MEILLLAPKRKHKAMIRILCFLYFLVYLWQMGHSSSVAETSVNEFKCSAKNPERVLKIGVITDGSNGSRIGKEQKTAIQMAFQNYHLPPCDKVELLFADSPRNSAQSIATVLDLISKKEVKAVIGTITREEIALINELNKESINIPIISLSSSSIIPPSSNSIDQIIMSSPSFVQMTDDINHHMKCIAALVGNFQWRKVTAIYEDINNFSFTTNMAILNLLSNSLNDVNSEISNHLGFSLSESETLIEEKLLNLSNNRNRVFVLVQSSVEFAVVLFKKARMLNMMENGYVWIVTDEVANLLDSLDSSKFLNLQGVIGCRTYFDETQQTFKKFKTKFKRLYTSEYIEDDGDTNPSIMALRAYDAYWAIATAMGKFQGEFRGKEWPQQTVLKSKFQGVSGYVRFENGVVSQPPTFQIINVVGRNYKEIAFWLPEFGFSDKLYPLNKTNATFNLSSLIIIWPGNAKTAPKGWGLSSRGKPLKIAVPTTAAFKEFVQVDGLHISGFSVTVFEIVASNLPYFLPYDLVPFDGPYDSLLEKVNNQDFDGAVGDFGIFADRFNFVDFSEPYIDNAVVMIVRDEPLKWTKLWLFMKAFTKEMWVTMFFMHLFVSFAIWLIERKHNTELMGLGSMLWFSVSVIFYVHREPVKNGLARLVLGPWLFVILIVTASFTASLSSMMTISRSHPSILDVETLKLRNETVGCNKNSVMVRFLSQVLSFSPDNVKQIASVDEFPDALANGEIKAAFVSGPHAKVFLAKHCKGYTKTTVSKLVGMGFAFPKGSPLTVDISTSIAELTERRELPDLETSLLSAFNCSSNDIHADGSDLGPEPFAGLFIISGFIALTAALIAAFRRSCHKEIGLKEKPTLTQAHILP